VVWLRTGHNLTLTEARGMAQNRPLWKLLATFGAARPLVVQLNDNDNDDECL